MSKVIKGLDKVIKDFKKFGKEGEQIVGDVAFDIANEINADAKRNAPKNIGKLSQSIFVQENTKLNYSVVVGLDYGAYVEFGTGARVKVPSELKDVASQFKNRKGDFAKGLQSIKDWCKSKGIEEKYAYPIFISILRKGLQPQPYLYPAFVKGRKSFLKDLEKEFNKLTKKYD